MGAQLCVCGHSRWGHSTEPTSRRDENLEYAGPCLYDYEGCRCQGYEAGAWEERRFNSHLSVQSENELGPILLAELWGTALRKEYQRLGRLPTDLEVAQHLYDGGWELHHKPQVERRTRRNVTPAATRWQQDAARHPHG